MQTRVRDRQGLNRRMRRGGGVARAVWRGDGDQRQYDEERGYGRFDTHFQPPGDCLLGVEMPCGDR